MEATSGAIPWASNLVAVTTALLAALTLARIGYVFLQTGRPVGLPARRRPSAKTLIVLGSGGHTAEMLNLLGSLDSGRFAPRIYVAAVTDAMSLQKAKTFEDSSVPLENPDGNVGSAKYLKIYRSREVGQSYVTSVGTTLIAMVHALWLILKIRPDVVICNGPGTCIPLCVSSFFTKIIGLKWSSIFYVESIARVRRLSLSGLLLYRLHLVDQLYVQWPQLQSKYPRSHYVGRLM